MLQVNRNELHKVFKKRVKDMLLKFFRDSAESEDTNVYLDSYYGLEKEFIDKWVEVNISKDVKNDG